MKKRLFRKKILGRKNSTATRTVLLLGVMLVMAMIYNAYGNQRLAVGPKSYKKLLDVIALAESNNNYNAYFGNANNAEVIFTEMTISEVQAWQAKHIKNGSPSSAVGRYQIISTTLNGLVDELDLNANTTLYNEQTQDTMAAALLERRGIIDYVNTDISKEVFAHNLSMEWAGLPKVIGENPNASFYMSDGLNKSHVTTQEVLQAISLVRAK